MIESLYLIIEWLTTGTRSNNSVQMAILLTHLQGIILVPLELEIKALSHSGN